jgi:hypothetical protein
MQKNAGKRALGTVSHGVQTGPGWITSHLQGRRVESTRSEGHWLIIRFWDSHEARIGWQNSSGNQIDGKPFAYNMPWTALDNCRITNMLIDGVWLILETREKVEFRIGWANPETREQFKGEPFLENLDVRICIEGRAITGQAAAPGAG